MNFDFKLKLNGVGPHANTELSDNIKSFNMAIYADNGSGKSFISKSFKRITDLKFLDRSSKENVEHLIEKTSAMVRFGEKKGTVLMSMSDQNAVSKELQIEFVSGQLPNVNDNTELVFHVFNSEYIRENLEAVKYRPEDKVSGFILGKANIDLSKEKELLERYQNEESCKIDYINKLLKKGIEELKSEGIQANTSEFKAITLNAVIEGKMKPESRSYGKIAEEYHLLTSVSDNTPDLVYPKFANNINQFIQMLNEVDDLVCKEFTLSSFSDEFKNKVKENQQFIEMGLQLSDGIKCPFCGQAYKEASLDIIDKYNCFLHDEETKIIKMIDDYISRIHEFSKDLFNNCDQISKTVANYDQIKFLFPSLNNKVIRQIDISGLTSLFETVCGALKEKRKNISLKGTSLHSYIAVIQEQLNKYINTEEENLRKIKEINSIKNNVSAERLQLRKALCNSKFNQLICESESEREKIQLLRSEQEKLLKEIEEKENQVKIDRRKKLIEKLKDYLIFFFKDKYKFDEEHFCVKYQDRNLIEDADYVLSDGEKSILAFCFYLANIHGIIEKENDYEKLFLIIDDPVSSMDFKYVYNVTQAIRNLKKDFNLSKVRYIILTHNMEFMSLLVRNKIVSQKYLFCDGHFTDFKNDYIMPYTSNLLDIYKTAYNTKKPTYTIPNQIRYVLETIQRFEDVSSNIADYISNSEVLSKEGGLYSLIQDCSHGGIRNSIGYTDKMIIESCKAVIEFIGNKFPGQIEEMKKLDSR